jgi:3-dehydrosphinganine reductase
MASFYRGKRVYITGGSSGIGLAAARQMVAAGAHVAIGARGQARLDAAAAELRARAAPEQKVLAVACDVGDAAAAARAAESVLGALGGIDVVVANAGLSHPSRTLDTPVEVFEQMMRINYLGTVYSVRPFLPALFAGKGGRIGVVSSLLGFMGIYGYGAYAASKFAQVGFAECLRQECLEYGVKITILYPPDTDTPMLAEENRIKPPETLAIAGEVKTMSAEAVAAALLRGIACGQLHVVPGASGGFVRFMVRHAPWAVRWVIDGELRKYRRRHAGG